MATKFATFPHSSQFFICRFCLDAHKRTHIVLQQSFVSRTYTDDGEYNGDCIFKNVVNVLTDKKQGTDTLKLIHCVRCNEGLGSKYVQVPPHYVHQKGSFYLITMANVCFWDGNQILHAEAGLQAVLAHPGNEAQVQPADPGQGNAGPGQEHAHPGNEAQVQPADPHNQGEDDVDDPPPGFWYYG